MAEINRRYLDRRTQDRYVEKGLLKDADLKAYMKALPDEAANAQYVQMDLHDAEISEDENMNEEDGAEEEV